MVLKLDIKCETAHTKIDVTSEHLEPSGQYGVDEGDAGEELGKRVEGFGLPVGKSTCCFNDLLISSHWSLRMAFTDDATVPPILIARIGNGQEIKARCIAKKVRDCCLATERDLSSISRELLKNTQNGLLAQPLVSNMIPTTSSDIPHTGSSKMRRRNGHLVKTQKRRNHRGKMRRSTSTRNRISSTCRWRRSEV